MVIRLYNVLYWYNMVIPIPWHDFRQEAQKWVYSWTLAKLNVKPWKRQTPPAMLLFVSCCLIFLWMFMTCGLISKQHLYKQLSIFEFDIVWLWELVFQLHKYSLVWANWQRRKENIVSHCIIVATSHLIIGVRSGWITIVWTSYSVPESGSMLECNIHSWVLLDILTLSFHVCL